MFAKIAKIARLTSRKFAKVAIAHHAARASEDVHAHVSSGAIRSLRRASPALAKPRKRAGAAGAHEHSLGQRPRWPVDIVVGPQERHADARAVLVLFSLGHRKNR